MGIEPGPAARSVSPLHHDQGEISLSPWNPIDQDRETSFAFGLSPWTVPWTSRFAAGPRPGLRAPGPAREAGA
jgi:hypothetical protein